MSILICGMEMPFTCLTCDFHKCAGGVGDFCSLTKKRQFRFKNRPKDCPLVELPPHGDLIDRDGLTFKKKTVLTGIGSTSFSTEAVLMADIKNAPTIIPASKEET